MLARRLFFCLYILYSTTAASQLSIQLSSNPSSIEQYASQELARYVCLLTGELPAVSYNTSSRGFIFKKEKTACGPQGYQLSMSGKRLTISSNDDIGLLYGVYGYLEEHMGINFSFDGDVLPAKKSVDELYPDINEIKTPAVTIRGFLPWTNFPQSATSYSWEDWKFILDQMAKMRMNFLQIHNYNGEEGHNEMFHNFEAGGKLSRVWMATAKSGHAWGSYPGWDVNKYPFGSSALFDDYDFGADCALHNEKLDNKQVFRKGVNEFQRVIAYAHTRGIKMGLGLDINLIPASYQLEPDDPKVITARVNQIKNDYPDLDYLLCFQSESLTHDGADKERARWRKIFDAFYYGLKKSMPQLRLAVAGWGLREQDVASLPKDVICAPISKYSDSFEDGKIYKDHEYWGCPWMERDFYSSVYYYPYNMHLSNTIKAWQERSPNMKGFYTLTWRITDAIKPKLWYMARAPWDSKNELNSSAKVYGRFAEQQYGAKSAALITSIINQNEPFASDWSECRWTPPFDLVPVDRRGQFLINLQSLELNNQTIAASNFSSQNQTRKVAGADGKEIIGYTFNGSWLAYENLDLSAKEIKIKLSSGSEGARIELHIDSLNGKLIGKETVTNTGGWNAWKELAIPVDAQQGSHVLYIVLREREPFDLAQQQLNKANVQLTVIDKAIAGAETDGQKYRIGLLRSRIAAARDHILLNMFASNRSYDIAALTRSWINNFNTRVTDISSLGNVVSAQNRFVQKNYRDLGWKQLNTYTALPPENIAAKGTKEGSKIYWKTNDSGIQGFYVYRDGEKINSKLLSAEARSYEDKINGTHQYEVHPVLWGNDAELPSISVPCHGGNADIVAPQIIVISPPTSVLSGQPVWIKARLLDERDDDLLSTTLYYRNAGELSWKQVAMTRKIKSTFVSALPVPATGLEYYIAASDGSNTSRFPADQFLSVVQENSAIPSSLSTPRLSLKAVKLQWEPVQHASYYNIYRSQQNNFATGPENYLTYIAADAALFFMDNGQDFKGQELKGTWYYKVTAVDKHGYESKSSTVAAIKY